MSKPLIFITNDDGISAPGLRCLIESMRPIGDIIVCAPQRGMSGMSHALTVSSILYLDEVCNTPEYKEYSCNGTPVDCIKLARHTLMDRNPDIIVSGINHGSNSSINVIYSGTMGVAIEGAIQGIPSVGFSLLDHSYKADFTASQFYARKIVDFILNNPPERGTCFNVNIPLAPLEELKGIKVCRQALGDWKDRYIERIDPRGKKYYWLTGDFENDDYKEDTDEWALDNKYVSIVPVHIDYTNHSAINKFKQLEHV